MQENDQDTFRATPGLFNILYITPSDLFGRPYCVYILPYRYSAIGVIKAIEKRWISYHW